MKEVVTVQINGWEAKQIVGETSFLGGPPTEETYPLLYNLSAAFMYRLLPIPAEPAPVEFIAVDVDRLSKDIEGRLLVCQWNMTWEAGQFRVVMNRKKLPALLQSLAEVEDRNIYLLPRRKDNAYEEYSPLYHLLPASTLARFGLPLVEKGQWPPMGMDYGVGENMPRDFVSRLQQAFASHLWPLLNGQSKITSFDANEPIRVLAHNLNFWLPYSYQLAERRLAQFDRVEPEPDQEETERQLIEEAEKANEGVPMRVKKPLRGGPIWCGEEDAWAASKELIDLADKGGKLRAIIDAVKSHRVQDDFSDIWSYAREDFERKLYSKRSKYKVSFVELDDTIPVHSAEAEIHGDLLWENLFALLDPKEKQIVVCLRNGATTLQEVSSELGYANHSPVSKALARIRKKARKALDE